MKTAKPTRERFEIVIADVGDPLTRHGLREREAAYRLRGVLKGLLRGYGFKCVSVAPERANGEGNGQSTDTIASVDATTQ